MLCSKLCFISYFSAALHDLKEQTKNCQNTVRGNACKIQSSFTTPVTFSTLNAEIISVNILISTRWGGRNE